MNANRLQQLFSITATCVLLSCATNALAQYIWLDEKGVKQYSDLPPPPSVPLKQILKTPGHKLPPTPVTNETNNDHSNVDPAVKAPPTLAEKNAASQKRKEEQAAKEKKAAEEAKIASDKATNCARARANQRTLDSGQRITQTDANGQRSYVSDEQRAQQTQENQRVLSECE